MATNPYSSQTIAGYNASPPPDDGSQTASNLVAWSKHKTKIGDPLKTLAEAINTACVSFGSKTINTDANENNVVAGSIAYTASELTIASGSVTPTRTSHTIDTEANGATDQLDILATGSTSDGAIIYIRADHTDRTVVVRNGIGSGGSNRIFTADGTDVSLDDNIKSMVLQRRGTDWYEIGRSTGLIQPNDASLILAAQIFG